MIVMAIVSDVTFDAEKIYEDQILNYINASQIMYPRSWSSGIAKFLHWYYNLRRGFVKKNGMYFSKGKYDTEVYIIEANTFKEAVNIAIDLYDMPELED